MTRYYFDTDRGLLPEQSPMELSVAFQNLFCPSYEVFNSLPLRLSSNPQFKIFRRIIQLVAINMMNILAREQVAPKFLLHYITMLKHMSTTRNDHTSVARTCKVRSLQLFDVASVFLWVTRANFSKFCNLSIMGITVTLCPQWLIAIRNFASCGFRILRYPPILIASLTQATLYISNFSPAFRGRTQNINLLATLGHVVLATEVISLIGNRLFASINDASRSILGYNFTHDKDSLSLSSRLRLLAATRGQNVVLMGLLYHRMAWEASS